MHRILFTCVLAVSIAQVAGAVERHMDAPTRSHAFKRPAKMEMLRPGEVKPQGWLRDWCVTARNGYISRMDEVDQAFPRAWNRDFHPRGKYLDWSDPNKGAWCTEGGAYWFEGLVRLAWELDDAELKTYATKRLEPLFERMNTNAIAFVYWMDRNDPAQMDEIEKANHGFIVGASGRTTRAMLAYYEATGDERALRALTWCLDDPRFYFFGNPITLPAGACDTWRYSGDDKLARAIDGFFSTKPYPERWPAMRYGLPVPKEGVFMRERRDDMDVEWEWRLQHGVLCFESMLSWVKASLWTGDGKYLDNVLSWLRLMEEKTLQPHGVTVADEQFGWAGPRRGTETCTVAGDILLYATLAGVTGEGRFADHVERSFFNAGAACVSRDFMHHAYFQSPNRTKAIGDFHAGPAGKGGEFKTKHWPLCCTAALTRILPGYVQWMWMKPATGGLAATLYAPNTLETDLDGVAVRINTKTDYPFNETMEMMVTVEKPVKFPLCLRVPGWCASPRFAVNGEVAAPSVGPDGYAVIDREWKTGDVVSLTMPMSPKTETRRDWNDDGKEYCSLSYGPLLFAYGLPEKDENTPAPGARTDWKLDATSVAASAKVVREPMPAKWNWPLASPLRIETKDADGARLELVPYGCAKLRISMFPAVLPRKVRLEWPEGGRRPEVVLDLGPGCDGGYAAFTAANVKGAPVVRASYATHPDGLGEKGDFWYETRATYLGPSFELPILPASVNRYDLFAVTNAGRYAAPLTQGLVRYVRLTLDTPGTAVDIDGFALENRGTYATEPTVGSFSCSDERLNAIWRMSVRTCQLSAIPAREEPLHVVSTLKPAKDVWLGPSYAYLADGAKRDRLVWSGDLWWAQRNMYAAYGYDSPYMPGSLRMLAENRTPEGYVQACPYPESHGPLKAGEWGPFASDEFAAWFVPVTWDHILHSGDRTLAKELYPVVADLVKYLRSHCRADGIFEQRRETSKHASSLDFGSASCYHRAYMNILNWKVYRDAADLAEWLGEKGPANEWRAAAETLAAAVRRVFWDAENGRFKGAIEADKYAGEANALALAVRFCTPDEAAQVRKTIKRHGHGKFQALFVRGLYEYGYPDDAEARIYEHGWDDVLDPSWKGAHLTSECMHLNRKGWGDEAHPDTAIAGILSNYILGVEPTEPGFAKYRVNPRPPKGVKWASGVVPTPWGELHVSWKLKNGKPAVKCREVRKERLPKVRGNVVLSDRDSATFFELRRDGQVLLHDHWLKELDGATNFEHRLVSVNAKDRSWRWRDGYLPILEIGDDVELFAKGDGLFIRRADEFTVWPEGRKVGEAEFLSARSSIVEYWKKWFAAGLQLPYQDKRVENACKASLVQGLCMFAGRHPVYGAGNYRTFIHDSFPPATLTMCETLIQFGHPEEAADVLVYYLDRFLMADGEIDYYGPSLAEYGGFMWVSSMVMDAVPARAAEVAAKVRPLVKAVLRRFNYQGPGGRVGPHKLLSGSPEADMKDIKDEYYHNNCLVLLGLRMIATRYHDVGDVFFANDIRKYARMLERMIGVAYSAKRAALGGVPYSEGQTRFYDDIQAEMNSTYANYRYYPELLESGWLSAEDAEWVVKYRESHNGEYHGMTLFSPPRWGSRTDNWPIASYARGLLEYGMRDRFEKVLHGMLDHYLSDDTFTAYEQVYTSGDPRTPAAPACVPAQLAFPRMLAWSFKYTPWKTLIRHP